MEKHVLSLTDIWWSVNGCNDVLHDGDACTSAWRKLNYARSLLGEPHSLHPGHSGADLRRMALLLASVEGCETWLVQHGRPHRDGHDYLLLVFSNRAGSVDGASAQHKSYDLLRHSAYAPRVCISR